MAQSVKRARTLPLPTQLAAFDSYTPGRRSSEAPEREKFIQIVAPVVNIL